MTELNRLRWRCRRGLLELDLILSRFAERELERLGDEERQSFAALLDYPDNDLWDLVSGRRPCCDARLQPVVSKLQSL
ncbi:FAD assembly factor SdhE [Pelomicrobium sp.]|mgnify:CR=1 FL=1|jgi:antitoxin CptB|uniref:FAD assembly factor SdhE n=1 Tax=Pelomicrobium sp. TaxID=2815319 RepID=UPI002FDE02BA